MDTNHRCVDDSKHTWDGNPSTNAVHRIGREGRYNTSRQSSTTNSKNNLLINIFTNEMQEVKDWTDPSDGTRIADKDTKQGKIIVPALKNGKVIHKNLRNTLEN